MPAIADFLKENIPKAAKAGGANLLFVPGYAKEFTEAESKLKAIVKIMADWYVWTAKILSPMRSFFIGGAAILGFNALAKAVRNIVVDTRSLQEALTKLAAIQISARQLAPFVGGLSAAKQRIAELTALSARGPFKFEEIAVANRSLEVFTRGAFSSAEATRTVGMAALATGNDITSVASAVAQFYQDLREGRPIEGAAENLRQMGLVSASTATEMVKLQQGGAQVSDVFNKLTESLTHVGVGASKAKDDLASVTAAHEKALVELQRQFGAPWTAAEITNTKNMTTAMNAIAPAVGSVSRSMQSVFGGFNTAKSAMIAFASRIPGVSAAIEGLGKAFAGLSLIMLVVGTVALPLLLPKMLALGETASVGAAAGLIRLSAALAKMTGIEGLAMSFTTATTAATLFAGALRLLTIASVVGLVVYAVTELTGVIINQIQAFRQVSKELEDMRQSFAKSNAAIVAQISAVKTLAEAHDALAIALNQSVSANSAIAAARQKDKEDLEKHIPIIQKFLLLTRAVAQVRRQGFGALFAQGPPQGPREVEAERERRRAERTAARARAIQVPGLGGPEQEAVMMQRAQEFRAEQEAQLQRQLEAAGPARRIGILQEQRTLAETRAQTGRTGLTARQTVAEDVAQIDKARQITKSALEKNEQDLAEARKKIRTDGVEAEIADYKRNRSVLQQRLRDIDIEASKARQAAPVGTGVQIEARAEQTRAAIQAFAAREAGQTKQAAKQQAIAGDMVITTNEQKKQAILALQNLDAASKLAKLDEESVTANEENARQLQAQIEQETFLYNITKARTEAEANIAALRVKNTLAGKAEGDIAEQVYKTRQQALKTEMDIIKARGTPDQGKIANLEKQIREEQGKKDPNVGRIANLTTELELEKSKKPDELALKQAQEKMDINKQGRLEEIRALQVTRETGDIDIKRREATLAGRSEEAVNLRNQEEMVRRIEQHRQEGMTQEEATQRAAKETALTIQEQATRQGGLPVVASQLARIGGGGGVYAPGGDPNTVILKRIQFINEASKTYLKNISDKVAQGGID